MDPCVPRSRFVLRATVHEDRALRRRLVLVLVSARRDVDALVARVRGLSAIACDLAAASKCLEAARSIEEPRALVLLQPVPPARPLRPAPDVLVLQLAALLCEPPLQAPLARDPAAIHTIMHTSGTTGLPKGVEYSDELWLQNMSHFPGDLCVAVSYQ